MIGAESTSRQPANHGSLVGVTTRQCSPTWLPIPKVCLWKRVAACRPFVREKSASTRRLDESLGWSQEAFKAFAKALAGTVQSLSELVGVYRAHAPAYHSLAARIQATDWLIDQIVYKLYGLTEEEIAIVEGRR